jgi:predicted enzyme related to lactoylglutathione lyase
MAIIGAHTIVYATDPDAARAFFRDVLQLPHVDVGGNWLIFRSPPAELAVHPTDDSAASGRPDLYLMCDDLTTTVEELRARGAKVSDEVSEQGWGRLTSIQVPGAGPVGLYEPRHPLATEL